MVRIGVAEWCLDCRGPLAIYRAARLGLSAIHIDTEDSVANISLRSLKIQNAYRKAIDDTGVQITAIAVNSLNQFGMTHAPRSIQAERCWEMIQLALDAALNLQVPMVYLPSFNDGEIHNHRDLMRTADAIRRACVSSEGSKILLATENTLDGKGNLELLAAVGHDRLRVLIDTLNPVLWGHSTSSLVEQLWPYMCNQIHAKDGTAGEMGNATLNTGIANFEETASTLCSLYFDGYLILENQYHIETETRVAADKAAIVALFPGHAFEVTG